MAQAFAVYSADDKSLSFYKRYGVPAAGEQFEGKTATNVYTGIEDGSQPDAGSDAAREDEGSGGADESP